MNDVKIQIKITASSPQLIIIPKARNSVPDEKRSLRTKGLSIPLGMYIVVYVVLLFVKLGPVGGVVDGGDRISADIIVGDIVGSWACDNAGSIGEVGIIDDDDVVVIIEDDNDDGDEAIGTSVVSSTEVVDWPMSKLDMDQYIMPAETFKPLGAISAHKQCCCSVANNSTEETQSQQKR